MRRILVAIVMVASVLMLPFSLAGIAGRCTVRTELADGLVGILTAANAEGDD